MTTVRVKIGILGICTAFFGIGAGLKAWAQMQESEYMRRMATVQRAAEKIKERKLRGNGSSGSPAANLGAAIGLAQRSFKAGDGWTVAYTPQDEPSVRKSNSPEDMTVGTRNPFHYDFKVVKVDEARNAQIEVRQQSKLRASLADPRVDHLVLSVNPQFVVISKQIFYRDGRGPRMVEGNGQTNVAQGFDSYPIDLPDLSSQDGQLLQEIPGELSGGVEIDKSKTLRFQFDDLFARPVTAIWQDGDPWPALVKKASGTSVLVSIRRRS